VIRDVSYCGGLDAYCLLVFDRYHVAEAAEVITLLCKVIVTLYYFYVITKVTIILKRACGGGHTPPSIQVVIGIVRRDFIVNYLGLSSLALLT